MQSNSAYTYTWNAENRLVTVTTNNPTAGDTKLTFAYDYQGRRVSKQVETWNETTSNYQLSTNYAFVYDG